MNANAQRADRGGGGPRVRHKFTQVSEIGNPYRAATKGSGHLQEAARGRAGRRVMNIAQPRIWIERRALM